jgi:hypothetical protein
MIWASNSGRTHGLFGRVSRRLQDFSNVCQAAQSGDFVRPVLIQSMAALRRQCHAGMAGGQRLQFDFGPAGRYPGRFVGSVLGELLEFRV